MAELHRGSLLPHSKNFGVAVWLSSSLNPSMFVLFHVQRSLSYIIHVKKSFIHYTKFGTSKVQELFYLVLKLPGAFPGPSLRSNFPVLDSGQERPDPALKVGAGSCGCRPGGLRALRQSLRCTFGANLGAAATVHLAPATRRSFQRRRTQPPGTRSRARRTVRGPAAVSDSRRCSALLRSPETSKEKVSCPCHLAQASTWPRLGDPMRQTPRDRQQSAAESREPRRWSPAHAFAVTAPGPRRGRF